MAEPTTAAVIGAIVAAKAAEKLGERISDSIADGIFGKKDEFKEIKKMLNEINQKVDEILEYSKKTLLLVQELPNVIHGLFIRERLHNAENNILSHYETYIRLDSWNNTLSYESYARLIGSWNDIIDFEYRFDQLMRIPRYGEFLLLWSNGQFLNTVINGLDKKIKILNSALKNEIEDELIPAGLNAERILKSQYVKKGELLSDWPWITYTLADKRTITVTECFPMPSPTGINGVFEICNKKQVPDSNWNSHIDSANSELINLKNKIENSIGKINSYSIIIEILNVYVRSLNSRTKLINDYPHVKVIESNLPFGE